MNSEPTILCVAAHPDDESLGFGPTLARYAAEGAEVHLITATRGQKGWKGKPKDYPGPERLGQIRSVELARAAQALGLRAMHHLGYMHGALERAYPREAVGKIARYIAVLRPQVVLTFGPHGIYGHPDHVAISQLTLGTVARSAATHAVSKLYFAAFPRAVMEAYQGVFGDLKSRVGGVERRFAGWEEWAVTTRLETGAHLQAVRQAILCHRSQLRDYTKLLQVPEASWQHVFGAQHYYRAFSLVNGGRAVERDLLEGVLEPTLALA